MANSIALQQQLQQLRDHVQANGGTMEYADLYSYAAANNMLAALRDLRGWGKANGVSFTFAVREDGSAMHVVEVS